MENWSTIFACILIIYFPSRVKGAPCPEKMKKCEWLQWNDWSECSRECAGGYRNRDRMLCCEADLAYDARLCIADCGWDYESTRHLFYDRQTCNAFCYNSGSYAFPGVCRCPYRYKGTCCSQVVTCGTPSTISHGRFSGYDFTYAGKITYRCDKDYNMTDSSVAVRECTQYGYWSGSSPRCLYAVSCNSSPCRNGASCVNLLGDYNCLCKSGWTGKNCDVDIQPPVVHGCPEDRKLFISEMSSVQTWIEPNITDPHETEVHITKNYDTSMFEFPWGEYTVFYQGVKTTNGLTAECKFNISVKPHPCKEMDVPVNGIMLCNGWRKDYSRICMFVCKENFRHPPGFRENDIYVCGATGTWFPVNQVSQCVSNDLINEGKPERSYACSGPSDRHKLAELYIERLKASSFNGLCQNYQDDCNHANVLVTC